MLWVGVLVVYDGRSAAFLSGLKGSFGESYGTSSLGHRRTRGYPVRAGALMALPGRGLLASEGFFPELLSIECSCDIGAPSSTKMLESTRHDSIGVCKIGGLLWLDRVKSGIDRCSTGLGDPPMECSGPRLVLARRPRLCWCVPVVAPPMTKSALEV
ncbi:hypothetical protein BHE74_00033458 [Ensete ventricosum]|nr:hypothetical protein BHE74_00033458 [Ensete ventricosum]